MHMELPKNKEEAVQELHDQLDRASGKIDELKLKLHLAKAELRDREEKRLLELERQRNQLKQDLHRLKHTSGAAWDDLAEGCRRSWDEFRGGLQQAMENLKN